MYFTARKEESQKKEIATKTVLAVFRCDYASLYEVVSFRPSLHLSNRLSVCPTIHLSIRLSVHPSRYFGKTNMAF